MVVTFMSGNVFSQPGLVFEKAPGKPKVTMEACPEFIGESTQGYFMWYPSGTTTNGIAKKTLVAVSEESLLVKTQKEFSVVKVAKQRRHISGFFMLNDELYVRLTFSSRKLKKLIYYAHKVNQQTLEIDENGKLIFEYAYNPYLPPFYYELSTTWISTPDRKHLLAVCCDMTSKTSCTMRVRCFDQNLSVTGTSSYSFTTQYPAFSCLQSLAANDGSLYYLMQEPSGEENTIDKIKLMRCWPDGRAPVIQPLEMFGEHPVDARMTLGKNGEVIVAGYYSDNGEYSVRGVFSGLLDTLSLKLQNIKVIPFSLEDRLRNLTEEQRKQLDLEKTEKPLEIVGYYINDVVIDTKNNIYVIGEEYNERVLVMTSTSTNTINTGNNTYVGISTKHADGEKTKYEYGKVLVSCLPASGKTVYNHYISKKQECDLFYRSAGSIKAKAGDNGVTVLYNAFNRGEFYLAQNMIGYERDRRSLYHAVVQLNAAGEVSENKLLCDFKLQKKDEPLGKYSCEEKIMLNVSLELGDGSLLMILMNEKRDFQVFRWK
ncbi:MAG: hypothetical protein ACHQF2_03565 [Flavobacteriales bacterium]